MVRQTSVASAAETGSCVAKLAEFFPNAAPARIPVQVMRIGEDSGETVVIEFGTADTVIFTSGLPLDFEERVRLKTSDQSLNTEAEIVALQFCSGKMAVAARFLGNVANWIIKE